MSCTERVSRGEGARSLPQQDPAKRPDANAMRTHPWLATSREKLESSWQDTLRGGQRPPAAMEPISAVVDATLSGAAGAPSAVRLGGPRVLSARGTLQLRRAETAAVRLRNTSRRTPRPISPRDPAAAPGRDRRRKPAPLSSLLPDDPCVCAVPGSCSRSHLHHRQLAASQSRWTMVAVTWRVGGARRCPGHLRDRAVTGATSAE